jgi:hypothetical protein
MTFSHAPWLVFTVFGLTVFWLALVAYFFYYTKRYQPAQFAALGEPSFNKGALRVISYIYTRKHRSLGDRRFSVLCDTMLICFTAVIAFVSYAFISNGRLPSIQSSL